METPVPGLREQVPQTLQVQRGTAFFMTLGYDHFRDGRHEEECVRCPSSEQGRKSMFEHYLTYHCHDVRHIDGYKALWAALKSLRRRTRNALSRRRTVGLRRPPVELLQANIDFVDEVEALLPVIQAPVNDCEAPLASLMQVNRITQPTDAVRQTLHRLGSVLEELSDSADWKEQEVLGVMGDYVEATMATKDCERFWIAGVSIPVDLRGLLIVTATTDKMPGTRAIGEVSVCGSFYTVAHGHIEPENGKKLRPATMVAVDLDFNCPKRSSMRQFTISVAYKDIANVPTTALKASQCYAPRKVMLTQTGITISDEKVLSPSTNVDSSISDFPADAKTTNLDGDSICWHMKGSVEVEDENQCHRWKMYLDDSATIAMPSKFRGVSVVEHNLKPFRIEIQISGQLRGFWTNSYQYLASFSSSSAETFTVEPENHDCLFTKEMVQSLSIDSIWSYTIHDTIATSANSRGGHLFEQSPTLQRRSSISDMLDALED